MTTPPEEERSGARNEAGGASAKRGFIERGIAAAYRARSLESRAGSLLSLVVVCALGAGLLAWYYGAALERPASAAEKARGLAAGRAQTEMALPPLLPIAVPASAPAPPNPRPDAAGSPLIANASAASPSWLADLPINAPAPVPAAPDPLPVIRPSDVVLARARVLSADGHLRDALRLLDRIDLADPARADGDRLKADIQRMLLATVQASNVHTASVHTASMQTQRAGGSQ